MPGPGAYGNKRKNAIKVKVAKLYPKKSWGRPKIKHKKIRMGG